LLLFIHLDYFKLFFIYGQGGGRSLVGLMLDPPLQGSGPREVASKSNIIDIVTALKGSGVNFNLARTTFEGFNETCFIKLRGVSGWSKSKLAPESLYPVPCRIRCL